MLKNNRFLYAVIEATNKRSTWLVDLFSAKIALFLILHNIISRILFHVCRSTQLCVIVTYNSNRFTTDRTSVFHCIYHVSRSSLPQKCRQSHLWKRDYAPLGRLFRFHLYPPPISLRQKLVVRGFLKREVAVGFSIITQMWGFNGKRAANLRFCAKNVDFEDCV